MKISKNQITALLAFDLICVHLRLSAAINGLMIVLAFAAFNAHAQPAWQPTKNIEIVVPSAPGGSNDKTARSIERSFRTSACSTPR